MRLWAHFGRTIHTVQPNIDANNKFDRPACLNTDQRRYSRARCTLRQVVHRQPAISWPPSTNMQDSTLLSDLSSNDEKLAAPHLFHCTEQAAAGAAEYRPAPRRQHTHPPRKRPQRKLKMGEVEQIEPRAPALCGGGGAPTSWRVGFLADPLSDRVRRLLGPPSLYGAHTGPFSAGRCASGMDDGRRSTAKWYTPAPACWICRARTWYAIYRA